MKSILIIALGMIMNINVISQVSDPANFETISCRIIKRSWGWDFDPGEGFAHPGFSRVETAHDFIHIYFDKRAKYVSYINANPSGVYEFEAKEKLGLDRISIKIVKTEVRNGEIVKIPINPAKVPHVPQSGIFIMAIVFRE